MTAKPRPRVLAVGSDQAFKRAKGALGSAVLLIRAQPADAALGRRHGGADLALADVRFERSRMIRLFRALNDSPDARTLPSFAAQRPGARGATRRSSTSSAWRAITARPWRAKSSARW